MKYFFIIFSFAFFACSTRNQTERKRELWMMVQSQNVDSIILATEEIRRAHDTSMVTALLYRANDPRITHQLSHKGKSVYQIKMEALEEITGVSPPVEITYIVDTSIVQFYRKILRQQ
jgi:hypothetical protein